MYHKFLRCSALTAISQLPALGLKFMKFQEKFINFTSIVPERTRHTLSASLTHIHLLLNYCPLFHKETPEQLLFSIPEQARPASARSDRSASSAKSKRSVGSRASEQLDEPPQPNSKMSSRQGSVHNSRPSSYGNKVQIVSL